MNKLQAIEKAKEFRGGADALLQDMKGHRETLMFNMGADEHDEFDDFEEVVAQHAQSIFDLESCIMRQGMALKYIGNPDPYPVSKLTVEDIAKEMYTKYCEAVGGRAWNGDLLPQWDEFSADTTKAKQIQGWLAAAATHPALHRVEPTSGGLKL